MKQFQLLSLVSLFLAATLLLAGCTNSSDKTPASSQTEPPSVSQPVTPENGVSSVAPDAAGEVGVLMGLLGKNDADVTAALGAGSATTDDAETVIVREFEMAIYGLQTITTVAYENDAANMIISYAAENQFDVWAEALKAELGAPTSENTDAAEGGDSQEISWVANGTIVSLKNAYDTLSLEIFPEA